MTSWWTIYLAAGATVTCLGSLVDGQKDVFEEMRPRLGPVGRSVAIYAAILIWLLVWGPVLVYYLIRRRW